MDSRVLAAAGVLLLLVALLGLMALGWRRRRRRQAHLATPAAVPAELGDVHARDRVFYVATTSADAPLDRITVAGLGFRAHADVTVASAGVVLDIPGETPVFVPRADLVGTGEATWTIDKAVGEGGLTLLRWRLGGTELDSYFRDAAGDVSQALTAIAPVATDEGTPS
jgi:hypothetical protein